MECQNLSISNLYKNFGKQIIFNGNNFSFKPHCLSLLIGNNGAGKTTLLDIIAGDDQDFFATFLNQSRNIFYFKRIPDFFKFDMVEDFVNLIANSYQQKIFPKYLDYISNILKKRICNLSTGEVQKLIIIAAMIAKAEITLLDEPTNGIDEDFKKNIDEIFTEIVKNSKYTIVTTHLFNDFKIKNKQEVIVGYKKDVDRQNEIKIYQLNFPISEKKRVMELILHKDNISVKKNEFGPSFEIEITTDENFSFQLILKEMINKNIEFNSFQILN